MNYELVEHYRDKAGGVRHDSQRFMGRNVNVAHFNPDTVAYTSPGSIYSESKHGNQNTASFSEKRHR